VLDSRLQGRLWHDGDERALGIDVDRELLRAAEKPDARVEGLRALSAGVTSSTWGPTIKIKRSRSRRSPAAVVCAMASPRLAVIRFSAITVVAPTGTGRA
jgi:hypothetical protein